VNAEDDAAPVVYELTIAGAIGPVIRSVLAPCRATPAQDCTIIRTTTRTPTDLVDLVLRLHDRGLVVDDIFEAVQTSSTVHDAAPLPEADR
jgi:hypothetical protein